MIGLDGMAWDIFARLFEHNAMPFLRNIINDTARGILYSTIPPTTAPAWTTLASGVNPGKHSIFDFLRVTRQGIRLVSSLDVKYPRIHEMLSVLGLRSLVVNLQLTYPIRPLRGTMVISDLIAEEVPYYPEELGIYAKRYPHYGKVVHAITRYGITDAKKRAEVAIRIYDVDIRRRVKVLCELAKKTNWDLLWAVITEPDALLHHAYDYVVSGDYRVLRIFNTIDRFIKECSKIADITVLVSDHGFRLYKYAININR
ncbi:MAG: hypothetical protein DRJ69_03865, partial [Thermoprotei archaeon]